MAEIVVPKAGKIQNVWEGILKWSSFAVMCLHLVRSILTYFISNDSSYFMFRVEMWIVLLLIAAAFAYVLYTKVKTPYLMIRIKNYTKGLLRPEFAVLVLFFIWSAVCTVVAEYTQTSSFLKSLMVAAKGTLRLFLDDSTLFDTFVSVFILFTAAYVFCGNRPRKMMKGLFHVLCAVLTIFMIYVLYVICNPGIHLPGSDGIGMSSVGRLGIHCNPNTTGAIAEIILLMCLYMVITKKSLLRWLYAVASAVHYAILALSNSRACIFATGIAVAAIVGKLCYDALINKVQWKRILITALAAAAAICVIIGMKKAIFAAFEAVSHFSLMNGEYDAAREESMSLSGRSELWIASVQSVFQDAKHFFFGVTPYGVKEELSIWTQSSTTLYTHNQFLEIAVAHGVPALLLYLAWLCMIARSCVNIVRRDSNETNKGMIVLAGMILMLVLSNMMEATLMYYRLFMEVVFFLICGMVTYKATV